MAHAGTATVSRKGITINMTIYIRKVFTVEVAPQTVITDWGQFNALYCAPNMLASALPVTLL